MLRSLMMVAPKKRPPEIVTLTTVGTQAVSVPVGALLVTAECISGGGASYELVPDTTYLGGGGGAYSKRTDYSMSGVTSLSVQIGDTNQDTTVSASSTVVCRASAPPYDANTVNGGNSASGVGDVKFSGGAGGTGTGSFNGGGGGAANDGGNGGAASGTTSGTAGSGTAASGAGGQIYGGGGQRFTNSGFGLRGWAKLTFTF